jgi:DNA-binding CsgD family transcriptional regulator/catechol 2,3-dioxygenase-like lactoylglutathione lyase family enzyme
MTAQKARGRPADPDILTPAEWQDVDAVRQGLTNRQIARLRNVSIDAVKYHVSNALTKLGLTRRAQLRQWPGTAQRSPIYNRKEKGKKMTFGPVGQIARGVQNIEEARKWYAEVLGLTHLYSFGDMAFFDCGGTRLFLSPTKGEGDSILYISVTDIHETQRRMEARGVVFINAPHMIHRHENGVEEWMAFFSDNDGRPLALMEQVTPEA